MLSTLAAAGVVLSDPAAPPAQARYADGGNGAYLGAIDWFEWGGDGTAIPAAGLTKTTTRTVAGGELATTCTISSLSGSIRAYRSGNWSGDGMDEMYNIGGSSSGNELVAGLANVTQGATPSFHFDCSTTLDGDPVPLAGLVMADAEQSGSNEYIQATIPAGAEWRLIDRFRTAGCTSDTTVNRTGQTLRMTGPAAVCGSGPDGIAFMDGATSADVQLKGGGVSAIALGVMLFNDFGDAPASYGAAGALYSPNFSGGVVPAGNSSLFGATLNTPTQPVTRLGGTVDSEANAQDSADATADGSDEDGASPPASITVTPGETYTLPSVACVGPGTVAGWIDWNGNGAFDAGERSNLADCTGPSVDLTWDVPEDAKSGTSFLRLRIGPTAASAGDPTGVTTAGEVEDYRIAVVARADFGDAPATYGTTAAGGGASHTVVGYDTAAHTSPTMLGDHVDVEDDATPGPAADGDDTAGTDDEDGVTFNPALGYPNPTIRTGTDPVTLQPVTNTLEVDASAAGFVSAWVDWNIDGDFDDAGERVANAQPVTTGSNAISFAQGTNPGDIRTYVRVRYSTDAGSIGQPTGAAPDGEVEDYRVLVERLITPAACSPVSEPYYAMTFPTITDEVNTNPQSGRYPDVTVVNGVAVDMIASQAGGGLAAAGFNVSGDDAAWNLSSGAATNITYTFVRAGTTTPISVNAVWSINDMDVGEATIYTSADLAGYALTPGSKVEVREIGATTRFDGRQSGSGAEWSRYQVWFQGKSQLTATWSGFNSSGFTIDGDGDLAVTPSCDDYGDAPDTYGTTDAVNGPHHTVTQDLRLGATSEFDGNGQPNAAADGDDVNRTDDEDGVAAPIKMTVGEPTTVEVAATNDTGQPATLAGWLDLDGDGTFEAGERVLASVGAGTSTYPVVFPAGPDTTTKAYARFRLFSGDVTDPAPTGAEDAGEVEDYAVEVLTRPLHVTKTSNATADSRPGDTITYTVTLTNTGTGDFTADSPARVVDDLADVLDDADYNADAAAEIGGTPATAPTYAEPRLTWEGPLAAGDTVTITYTATLTGDGDRVVRNVAWVPPLGDPPGATPDCYDPAVTVPCVNEEYELPSLSITKTSDRVEVNSVGDQVTYTVTVKNEGPGDYTVGEPATFGDDLSEVLDDATYVDGSETADAGTASFSSPTLSWSGVLASGDAATITYTVRYTGAGDGSLENSACVPEQQALDPSEPCDTVITSGSRLTQTKTTNPADGEPVDVGDEITYTLTFTNDGTAPALVDTTDDLSDVLDDGEIVDGPTPQTPLSATPAGDALVITGFVPAGESRTVTYTVEVAAPDTGNGVLLNTLACQPGEPVSCVPETTEHPLRQLRVTKTSDAGADTRQGDTVTYTVTAENIGAGDYTAAEPARVVDDLTGVLDDADYNGDATADLGSAPAFADPRLTWEGALPAGDTVTITYTVELKAGGDGVVRNVAWAPDPGDPAGPTPDCDDPDTTVPCDDELSELPKLSITKDASPDQVNALGQVVTFTVTVTNDGPGDYTAAEPATFADDLSTVLDDATLVDGSVTATWGDAVFSSPTLSWTGVLTAGQSATVTYQVRYTGVGNHSVVNAACVPEQEATDPAQDCATVTVPGAGLSQTKTADPASGTTIGAGDRVTYTLTFTNTGDAPATVDTTDTLTDVVDDASLVTGPTAQDGLTAVRDGNLVRVTGSVPPGQTRTVTYTVEVEPYADQGDHVLRNALACQPGEPVDCAPETTEHPIGHLTVAKTSDATAGIDTGDQVTYTITVLNDGATTYDPAVVLDDLSDVLDDATYAGASADRGSVSFTDPTLTWTGRLEPGQEATITYDVTVTNQGDHDLGNIAWVPDCDEPGCNPPPVVTDLPYVVPDKTTDPPSGDSVQAGDEVAYTLTWTNEGKAPGVLDAIDDLSDVLDDAEPIGDPVSSSPDVTVTRMGDTLRIVGPIDPGETVTVTYQVRIKPDGQRGDNLAGNVLTPDTPQVDCDDNDDCEPVGPPVTENPIGELDDAKSVEPGSGNPVLAGDELTYTLTFTNVGMGTVDVDREDDLSGVLDDATLVSGPKSSQPALTVSGPDGNGRIRISGTLEPGQTVTVAYTVRVKKKENRGDGSLANFLVDPGEDPPPHCNVRVAARAEAESSDCTANPASDIEATKDVDQPHASQVGPGDLLTYTLRFENRGDGADQVDYLDDIADVLDDVAWVDGPDSSSAALTARRHDKKLHITGKLEPDQVVKITYAVRVRADGERGNDQLNNYLFPEGGVSPGACQQDTGLCTTNGVSPTTGTSTPEQPGGDDLPDTGARFGPGLIVAALLCLLAGIGLVVVSRRRSDGEDEPDVAPARAK